MNCDNRMKKICVITSARSEYGLLKRIIQGIDADAELELQVIAAGGHMSPEQGSTYLLIEEDGVKIDRKIEFLLTTETGTGVAKSAGLCAISIADAFEQLRPDVILVLGDRYELMPICTTAMIMSIPIAHISGGDVTEGAIDNYVRNAVTMMSAIHFSGPQSSADNIVRMIGTSENVFPVGEPGLENLKKSKLMTRKELAENLKLDINKHWVLCTLHSETMESIEQSMLMAHKMIDALLTLSNAEIILTYANADLGGCNMNLYYEEVGLRHDNVHVYKSLGQLRYNSMMAECWCVVGNSSSGIVEAPFIGKPVVNIGNRQKGRYMSPNIINVPTYENNEITEALAKVDTYLVAPDFYWGDGNVSGKIIKYLKTFLYDKR